VPKLFEHKLIESETGTLLAVDFGFLNNWTSKRTFVVGGVPAGVSRGNHAHKACDQVLTCWAGKVLVEVDDTQESWKFELTPDSKSLFIPAGLWAKQTYINDDSVLIVAASDTFNEADYFRNRTNYEEWIGAKVPKPRFRI
jgi:UDP-2-acetamido-3-amino-2,3-dideoxy-glucuronate N-acetyltransferase